MIRTVASLTFVVLAAAPALAVGTFGPGTAFCFGDGSMLTACPCAAPDVVPAPSGGADGGCANAFDLGGGKLDGAGSSNPDAVTLSATRLPPDSFSVFFAGDGAEPDGLAFGDGVKCVRGVLLRFGGQVATGGVATYPRPEIGHTLPLHDVTASSIGGGATIYYQVLYRNAAGAFCNPSPFNLTNGYQVTWN